jgi:hypothetical protein
MDSSKTLKETVARAQKEIKELLADAQAGTLDRKRLETKLKEVQGDLKVIDIHIGKREPDRQG